MKYRMNNAMIENSIGVTRGHIWATILVTNFSLRHATQQVQLYSAAIKHTCFIPKPNVAMVLT